MKTHRILFTGGPIDGKILDTQEVPKPLYKVARASVKNGEVCVETHQYTFCIDDTDSFGTVEKYVYVGKEDE
jgi:benzoyl-CoA reductase/2-hydroxyglutaryl-CoA dehydratase subunit BcrC/BadD/HgdB